jgi:hypothetical protein
MGRSAQSANRSLWNVSTERQEVLMAKFVVFCGGVNVEGDWGRVVEVEAPDPTMASRMARGFQPEEKLRQEIVLAERVWRIGLASQSGGKHNIVVLLD